MATASAQVSPTFSHVLSRLPSSLIWGVLGQHGCYTHGRGCLLQALEQVYHLGLFLHIFHLLPPQGPGQVVLRTSSLAWPTREAGSSSPSREVTSSLLPPRARDPKNVSC